MNEFRVLADDNKWRYFSIEMRDYRIYTTSRNDRGEQDVIPMWRARKGTVGRATFVFDKNKKEIYEGDIVAIKHSRGEVENYIIQWGVKSLSWELLPANRVVPYSDDYISDLGSYASEGDILTRFKIIGNIHQNPELLEKEENSKTPSSSIGFIRGKMTPSDKVKIDEIIANWGKKNDD